MAQCEGIGPHIDPPPYERPVPVYLDDLEVTENGEYTPEEGHAYGSVNVDVSGGGGNVVAGTFMGAENGNLDISIPYDGEGFPVLVAISALCQTFSGSYNMVADYTVSKQNSNAPNYLGGNADASTRPNNATFYTIRRTYGNGYDSENGTAWQFHDADPDTGWAAALKIKNATTISVRMGAADSQSNAFITGATYSYMVLYSS